MKERDQALKENLLLQGSWNDKYSKLQSDNYGLQDRIQKIEKEYKIKIDAINQEWLNKVADEEKEKLKQRISELLSQIELTHEKYEQILQVNYQQNDHTQELKSLQNLGVKAKEIEQLQGKVNKIQDDYQKNQKELNQIKEKCELQEKQIGIIQAQKQQLVAEISQNYTPRPKFDQLLSTLKLEGQEFQFQRPTQLIVDQITQKIQEKQNSFSYRNNNGRYALDIKEQGKSLGQQNIPNIKKKKQLNKSVSYKKSHIIFNLQNQNEEIESPQIALLKQSEESYSQQPLPVNRVQKQTSFKQNVQKQNKTQFGDSNWQNDNSQEQPVGIEQQFTNLKEINELNVTSNKFLHYIQSNKYN